jgi:ferric-dicitrate binding protein FerR (iron transport regulator)
MNLTEDELDDLLSRYFSGSLTGEERERIDAWVNESSDNKTVFNEYVNAWESTSLLSDMEQYNSFEALKKITPELERSRPLKWLTFVQRAAAILLLPLMTYTGYLLLHKNDKAIVANEIMQKVSSRQGMVSQFILADGTKVWLNSGSELEFPLHFTGARRNVKLKGEAFFEVTENKEQPFRVTANNLNIEVLGTSFNVVSFDDDSTSEVVLVKGKVALSIETQNGISEMGFMSPGQKAVYDRKKQNIVKESVDTDKYIAWREGFLIFRDDTMEEVAKRLSRWFNVEINLNDSELKSYTYQATFRNENLMQVLNLLKLSSPIDYKITQRKLLPNGEFTKQKISIMRKTN